MFHIFFYILYVLFLILPLFVVVCGLVVSLFRLLFTLFPSHFLSSAVIRRLNSPFTVGREGRPSVLLQSFVP